MMPRQLIQLLGPLLALLPAALAYAQAPKPTALAPEALEFFEKKVRPLLSEHCYQCHSAKAEKGIKGGLALDTRDATLRGGDAGPAVVPGSPDASRLIRAVRWKDDLKMPPKKPLPPEQVAVLEQWVKMGAPDPRVGGAPAAPATGAVPLEEAKRFWSYQPVKDPPVPAV